MQLRSLAPKRLIMHLKNLLDICFEPCNVSVRGIVLPACEHYLSTYLLTFFDDTCSKCEFCEMKESRSAKTQIFTFLNDRFHIFFAADHDILQSLFILIRLGALRGVRSILQEANRCVCETHASHVNIIHLCCK